MLAVALCVDVYCDSEHECCGEHECGGCYGPAMGIAMGMAMRPAMGMTAR